MQFIDGHIVDFTLEERGEVGIYTVNMEFDAMPFIGVYGYGVGFLFSSLKDEYILNIFDKEIKKLLKDYK